MRLFICAPLLLAACSAGGDDARPVSLIQVTGQIDNKKLNEASGLARSNREPDVYWAINDDGPAVVHALNSNGANLGEVEIAKAKNRDWEDIASFTHNGIAYLAIAYIGDNAGKRKNVTIYVVAEPATSDAKVEIAWRIDYTYPDGPLDAEALAVDAAGETIYVLSKRTIPAVLYQLPLMPASDEVIVATRVAEIVSLPQPSEREVRDALSSGWSWQPTSMDFSPDGNSALILTYAGVNYFPRSADQTWPEALQGQAMQLKLGKYENAESITYAGDSNAAIVTIEKKHAPILRIDLSLQKDNKPNSR